MKVLSLKIDLAVVKEESGGTKRSVRSQPCHLRDGRHATLLDLAATLDIHAIGSASQTRHCHSQVAWSPLGETSKNGHTNLSFDFVATFSQTEERPPFMACYQRTREGTFAMTMIQTNE